MFHLIETTDWAGVSRRNQQRVVFDRYPYCLGRDADAGYFVWYNPWEGIVLDEAEARRRSADRAAGADGVTPAPGDNTGEGEEYCPPKTFAQAGLSAGSNQAASSTQPSASGAGLSITPMEAAEGKTAQPVTPEPTMLAMESPTAGPSTSQPVSPSPPSPDLKDPFPRLRGRPRAKRSFPQQSQSGQG